MGLDVSILCADYHDCANCCADAPAVADIVIAGDMFDDDRPAVVVGVEDLSSRNADVRKESFDSGSDALGKAVVRVNQGSG